MAKTTLQSKKFTIAVSVTGNLHAAYVFTDEDQYQRWLEKTFPTLESTYGPLKTRKSSLPGFVPGDRCMVYGEGLDVFEIERVVQFSHRRYGFVLKGHGAEEVAKCFWDENTPRV